MEVWGCALRTRSGDCSASPHGMAGLSEVQRKGDNVTTWLRGELTSKMLRRRELCAPPADVLWDVLVFCLSFFCFSTQGG